MITSKQIYFFVLVTFITLVIWVIFDVLHNRAAVRPTPDVQKVIEPVDPNFDQDTINQL